jgi:hypothetical protein
MGAQVNLAELQAAHLAERSAAQNKPIPAQISAQAKPTNPAPRLTPMPNPSLVLSGDLDVIRAQLAEAQRRLTAEIERRTEAERRTAEAERIAAQKTRDYSALQRIVLAAHLKPSDRAVITALQVEAHQKAPGELVTLDGSSRRLQKITGVNEKTVRATLKQLQDCGAITYKAESEPVNRYGEGLDRAAHMNSERGDRWQMNVTIVMPRDFGALPEDSDTELRRKGNAATKARVAAKTAEMEDLRRKLAALTCPECGEVGELRITCGACGCVIDAEPVEVGELNTNEPEDAATRNILPGQAAAQGEGGPDPAPTIEPGWAEAGERAPVLSPARPVPALSELMRNILPCQVYTRNILPGQNDAEGGGYHA